MAGKIASSGLTDWQKIDALNTFVVTKASYQFSEENARCLHLQNGLRTLQRTV